MAISQGYIFVIQVSIFAQLSWSLSCFDKLHLFLTFLSKLPFKILTFWEINQKRQGRNCHSIYTNDLFVKYNMWNPMFPNKTCYFSVWDFSGSYTWSRIRPVVKDGFMVHRQFPTRQFPTGQHPTWQFPTQIFSHAAISHPYIFPPGQFLTATKPHPDIFPPGEFPLRHFLISLFEWNIENNAF